MQVMQFRKIIKSYSPYTLISSSIVNQVNQALLMLTQSKSSSTYTSKSLADLECYAFLFSAHLTSSHTYVVLLQANHTLNIKSYSIVKNCAINTLLFKQIISISGNCKEIDWKSGQVYIFHVIKHNLCSPKQVCVLLKLICYIRNSFYLWKIAEA